MIKILGSIVILISSTLIGFYYGTTFKKRVSELNEIHRSLQQLKNQMEYAYMPLPQIFYDLSEKSIYPINDVFKDISTILYSNEVNTVYEAFKKAFSSKKDTLNLNANDMNIILDFAKTLGESDIEGQKGMLDLTTNNIKKQIEMATNIMYKNVKMCRCLGFALGAAVVIILI